MNLHEALELEPEKAVETIVDGLRNSAAHFRRRGAVLGLSGGIDSSVTAALCVEAFGANRTLGLLMPETDSAPESEQLATLLAEHLQLETITENITPLLTAARAYERRDDAFRSVLPDYGPGWKSKIVLPSLLEGSGYRISQLVAMSPGGQEHRVRLTPSAYLEAVAATNFKQRTRKMLEYFHADRLNRLVTGTPNRLEYELGFFVKLGDGSADVKPIAHLYKAQVYQLAAYFGLPDVIQQQEPTTDTFSLPQSQEEFYFSVPHRTMDLCLLAVNNGITAEDTAGQTGLTVEQVERVFDDIKAKRRVAEYLHAAPVTLA